MGKPNTKNKPLPKDYSQTDTTFIKNIYPFGYNDYSGSYRTIPNMADWKQIAMNPMFLKSNLGYITSPEDQAKALGVIRDRLSNIPGQESYVRYLDSLSYNKDTTGIQNLLNEYKGFSNPLPEKFLSEYTKQYGLGGTIGSLAGTAIGGPLGSMVFGTLGNVVDSIIGSNKAAKEQQAQADLVKKQQEQAKLDQIEGLQSSSTFSNPFAPTFPFGGLMGYGQAELEKQEAFQTPSGEGAVVNAPTHNEGGIKLELPYGTRIYSDRLKKGNSTFADLAEPLIKLRKKYEK